VTAQLLLEDEVSAGEAIVRVLIDAGIDAVFGMPGGYTFAIFDALRDHSDQIRTVLVREEARAGVMAEVYGRLTGRPGVAIGQGAFLIHASLGALEGHLSSSPMLLLGDLSDNAPFSQHGPYQSGTGEYGGWDARATFSGFTKDAIVAGTPAHGAHSTQLAIKAACSGEPGPVAVLFHSQSLRGKVNPSARPALYAVGATLSELGARRADEASVEAAAAHLLQAERPVILAGNGVRLGRAATEVARLAEAIGAPVATTAAGKGCYPETGPWALGVCGNFGTPLANAVVGAADVVLVVGSKLAPTDTAMANPALFDPRRQTIIQVEIEPRNAGWTMPVDVALIGQAKAVLEQLLEAVGEVPDRRLRDAADLLGKARADHGYFDAAELYSDAVPILPQRVIGELARSIGDDAIVCCDAGENRIFMTHYFQTRSPDSFVQPAGVGGMGYAIPAALAAKVVRPNHSVVAVCGDGGFAIGMNGLMTALEEQLPIVVVVLNNQALGWVKHGQRDRPIACDFREFDHAAIARAMGCGGIRVEKPDELGPALKRARESGEPTVVDVRTSLSETYERVTSPLMRRG
jgi:acetolactate synthase-1/2/3 large subunit